MSIFMAFQVALGSKALATNAASMRSVAILFLIS